MLDWFNERYGSRRGFVNSKWYQIQYYLGRYQQYHVPWHDIRRLVFVCTGNICRSAFAEAVAKSIGVDAISVGVHAVAGAPADTSAMITAKNMGYDLGSHQTMQIMYPQYKKSDLFLAMEPWQASLVQENLSPDYYTSLLGMWGNPVRPYILDPFMRSKFYFQNCFNYIEKTVNLIAQKIRTAN